MASSSVVETSELLHPSTHRALLTELVPLRYDRPPPQAADVAPHVRAASAVRRLGGKLWIVQDDVNAVAIYDDGSVTPVLLPPGPGQQRSFGEQRGNKRHKLDLEASVMLPDGRLLGFGSGSTSARERLVLVDTVRATAAQVAPTQHIEDANPGAVRVRDASDLYRMLRECREFSGSELNIEGVVIVGEVLRFVQRGNGAVVDGCKPVNATADVPFTAFLAWLDGGAPLPALERVRAYDLGVIEGVPWTFTDATVVSRAGALDVVVFVGAAEASPDTYHDGEVVGSCVGIFDGERALVWPVLDEQGGLAKIKLEGIEHRPDSRWSFDVVADMDDPEQPAVLGRLELAAMR